MVAAAMSTGWSSSITPIAPSTLTSVDPVQLAGGLQPLA